MQYLKKKTVQLAVVALLAAFGAGLVAGEAGSQQPPQMPQPHCPTEDSCKPLYQNGHWRAVPDRP